MWLKPGYDKIIKYRHSCKNEQGFWMSGYNNDNNNTRIPLVQIVLALTLIAGSTITYFISPYDAKAESNYHK
jgi:hypothetical protein